MRPNPRFQVEQTDLVEALARQPLCWVQSTAQPALASPLPLVVVETAGRLQLHGHFARNNPLVTALAVQRSVEVLWLGQSGYQSPSWLQDRSQAPTFVYTAAQFTGDLCLLETPTDLEFSVERVTAQMEQLAATPGVQPWSTDELGPRRLRGIVAFRIAVAALQVQFKLGQNERADVFDDACRGFERHGAGMLAKAMRDARSEGT
ncbi:MAG: FMN-binding negative transcriptional regulator [Xanthomonadales bacterium]|jgi:transcriptional regulator|nr:FMN-binding negative transcriptional regulator [Xanthomonadales bacterium]